MHLFAHIDIITGYYSPYQFDIKFGNDIFGFLDQLSRIHWSLANAIRAWQAVVQSDELFSLVETMPTFVTSLTNNDLSVNRRQEIVEELEHLHNNERENQREKDRLHWLTAFHFRNKYDMYTFSNMIRDLFVWSVSTGLTTDYMNFDRDDEEDYEWED